MVYIKEDYFIDNKIKELKKIKEILYEDDNYMLSTHNNKTNQDGVALFHKNENIIKVFEGNDDGSDDKEMDYNSFLYDYSYKVVHENGKILSSLDILNYNNNIFETEKVKSNAELISHQIFNILNARNINFVDYDFVHGIVKNYVDDNNLVDDVCYKTINILNDKYHIEYSVDIKI